MSQRAPETKVNEKTAESVASLLAMLTFRRPAGSKTERQFINRFISPTGAIPDKRGNYALRIGNAPVMWSCHTDTVHSSGGRQLLSRIGDLKIGVAKSDPSNCLGADDTAGVWLMLEMIKAKVEGLYVFHRDEEHGCKGSRWLVKNNPTLVEGIKFAIALDRRNKDDVITFQSGSRCCSDEFATSLAYQLDMGYKPSPHGMFTDTAHYTDLIGECTNISVGYTGAHSKYEDLDGMFLFALRDKLLSINVGALVEKRKAGTVERKYQSDYGYGYYSGGSYPYNNFEGWGDEVIRNQYSLGANGHCPRAGAYGYWDAAGNYHGYSDTSSKPYKYGSGHTVTPVGEAIKSYEEKADRQKWWERLFAKAKAAPQTTTSVVPYERPSRVRTVSEDLQETTATEDEMFFNGSSDGLTLERLVRNHPAEVADFLDQYGVDVDEMAQFILETGAVLRCK